MPHPTLKAVRHAVSANIPCLLWGSPGVGKTAAITQLAESMGAHFEVLVGGLLAEPADISGVLLDAGEGRLRRAEPTWFSRIVDATRRGQRSIILIDELTCATPQVQATLLRLVQERAVGDSSLPDDCAIIGAANPADLSTGGAELSPPTISRWCHLQWDADFGAWSDWMLARTDFRQARARIVGHIAANRSALMPSSKASNTSDPYPCPRSWDAAARALGAAGPDTEAAHLLLAGCVGSGAASEFVAWERGADLPDAEDVLAGRAQLPKRLDAMHASLLSLVAAVNEHPTEARWAAAWDLLDKVGAGGRDLAAVAATMLARSPSAKILKSPACAGSLAQEFISAGAL